MTALLRVYLSRLPALVTKRWGMRTQAFRASHPAAIRELTLPHLLGSHLVGVHRQDGWPSFIFFLPSKMATCWLDLS